MPDSPQLQVAWCLCQIHHRSILDWSHNRIKILKPTWINSFSIGSNWTFHYYLSLHETFLNMQCWQATWTTKDHSEKFCLRHIESAALVSYSHTSNCSCKLQFLRDFWFLSWFCMCWIFLKLSHVHIIKVRVYNLKCWSWKSQYPVATKPPSQRAGELKLRSCSQGAQFA